ncbi:DUF6503 family protein [Nonlabens ponticola]|uniref:Threonine synthase n=1 Tax=Nonlabens ponticola TaxID=2496866 RepID=A0A3S9MV91_9FLAO|nr:DUF6503 family protein [Nonlabens ponticola]AZQ43088.1 threonine synthase [Nonlabens ponticola]
MKNTRLLIGFLAIAMLIACKPNTENEETTENTTAETSIDMDRYPADLQEVFENHGGLEKWRSMQSLTYTMPKPSGDEVHTIDLTSRKTLIETDAYQLGFDGDSLWLQQDEQAFDPARAEFYYNLMFYFYAMPFVLADDGIQYEQVRALEKDGTLYPGTKISYADNVGNSPEDNYIIYYDPDTKKMAWLAYTVTYGQDTTSEKYSFIHYNKWQDVNGLWLPELLTWYQVEDGQPTVPAGEPRAFNNVDIDASAMGDDFYSKPENATTVN